MRRRILLLLVDKTEALKLKLWAIEGGRGDSAFGNSGMRLYLLHFELHSDRQSTYPTEITIRMCVANYQTNWY